MSSKKKDSAQQRGKADKRKRGEAPEASVPSAPVAAKPSAKPSTPSSTTMPLGARSSAAWAQRARQSRGGRAALRQAEDAAQQTLEAMENLRTLDADEEDEDDAQLMDDEDAEEEEHETLQIDDEPESDEEEEEDAEEDDEDDDEDEEDEGEDDEEDSLADSQDEASAPASARSNGSAASSARRGASTTDDDEEAGLGEDEGLSAEQIQRFSRGRAPKVEFESDELPAPAVDDRNLAEGSDSSADEGEDGQAIQHRNRIGNVPLEWYNDMEHIGYDVTGKKIIKSVKGDKLDQLLARMDDPNWNRTIHDPVNDVSVVLTNEELAMLTRLRKGQFAHASFNPSNDAYTLQTFTEDIRHEVLGQSIEPKRRFIPSKWEAKTVVKYVNAMRNGWMKLPSEVEEEKKEKQKPQLMLLWGEDGAAIHDHASHVPHRMPARIAAPKAAPPTHAESYNPPREYLPTEEEKAEWESMDPEDRPTNFLPRAYTSMRAIPAYEGLVKERFSRCLDLYLCPRAKVKKLRNLDPASLIPNLPRPADLRPFPTSLNIEYRGHQAMVRSISVSPDGQWLASGSDDGTVRVWEVATGRCFRKWDFANQRTEDDDSVVVECVAFNPNPALPLLAVCVGTHIFLMHTHTITSGAEKKKIQSMLQQPSVEKEETSRTMQTEKQLRQVKAVTWTVLDEIVHESADGAPLEPTTSLVATESLLKKAEGSEEPAAAAAASTEFSVLALNCTHKVKHVSWHHKGDYFASVATVNTDASSVLIHRLSQHASQSPFSKSKGLVMQVHFHPHKPFFFVLTRRHVRIYNLQAQTLVKKLLCPAKWLSSLSIHPGGDHLLAASYDRKVCWYDLDLSSAPYKTLKYHGKAVRDVRFHPKAPLFASASDDGQLHVFHGRVYDDLTTDPLIVPVKILRAHEPVSDVGVLSCVWHPTEPWIFSSGADKVVRLFTC